MPNVMDVANQLAAIDRPVLFVDTCVLLDVVRSIKRRAANCAFQAAALHAAVTSVPVECQLVVSHVVHHEWGLHQQEVLDEASRHLVEIEDQARHFHDACDVFGIAPGFGRANYAGIGIAARLHDLSRKLLHCGVVVDLDDECSGRAMSRVIHNTPPSRKGGEAKDCTILEAYLAVCRRLQANGFSKKMVFCTSNTNDYCDGARLHAILAAEFAAIGLGFTTNLGWGFYDATN